MKISVKINVYNEEDNVAAVCESVSWADEIVIGLRDASLIASSIVSLPATRTNTNSLIR